MHRVLVVDDEPLARNLLKKYIRETSGMELLAEASSPLDVHEYIEEGEVDILFLDIKMEGISGLDYLKMTNRIFPVVLTTAFSEFALDGFDLGVTDYLLKPISYERFVQAYLKCLKLLKKDNPSAIGINDQNNNEIILWLKHKDALVKVPALHIQYIKSDQGYSEFHIQNGSKYLLQKSLDAIIGELPANFYRIHRSFIVNKNFIAAIKGNTVEINKKLIPIGKTYRSSFLKYLKL